MRKVAYSYPIGGIGFPTHYEVSDQVACNLPIDLWNNIRDRLIFVVEESKELKLWISKPPYKRRMKVADKLSILHSILFVDKSWYAYVIENSIGRGTIISFSNYFLVPLRSISPTCSLLSQFLMKQSFL